MMAEQEAAKAQEAARLARETALTHDVMQREESERRLAEAEEARQHSLAKFISELSVLPMLPGETADQRAARLELHRLHVIDPRSWVRKERITAMEPKLPWASGTRAIDDLHSCHVLYELVHMPWRFDRPSEQEPDVERLTGTGKEALVQFLFRLRCLAEQLEEFAGVPFVPERCVAPDINYAQMYARELQGNPTLTAQRGRANATTHLGVREHQGLTHIKSVLARAVLNRADSDAMRYLCICLGDPELHRRTVAFSGVGNVSDAAASSANPASRRWFYGETTPFAFNLCGEPIKITEDEPWLPAVVGVSGTYHSPSSRMSVC